jgi:two-component system cell cycle response regulator
MLLVEKQKLLRDLESSGVTDPITGLPNARGLGKSFQRMTKLTMDKPLQSFLLLMEVDGLDKVKSTLGQGFANFLLAKIGEVIEVSFRDRDIIASTNSNEFACILPNLSQDKALDIAERFRSMIEQTSFDCPTTENGKFSCTVSIAIVSAEMNEEIKTLLNRARIGINQAKSLGGNQSVCI